jgi:hypothetical protein
MRRTLFVVIALLAMAGAAQADFGTISVTETHVFTGTWSVDMTMHVTTVGATSPQTNDWMGQNGQLYYPYTWNTAHPLYVTTTAQGFEQSGRTTNGGSPFARDVLYSFTCPDEPGGTEPTAGLWAFWLGVWAIDGGGTATTWTTTVTAGPIPVTFPYDPAQPTPTPPPSGGPAIPVPSLNTYGMVAMVLMIIGVAVLVMWRRN